MPVKGIQNVQWPSDKTHKRIDWFLCIVRISEQQKLLICFIFKLSVFFIFTVDLKQHEVCWTFVIDRSMLWIRYILLTPKKGMQKYHGLSDSYLFNAHYMTQSIISTTLTFGLANCVLSIFVAKVLLNYSALSCINTFNGISSRHTIELSSNFSNKTAAITWFPSIVVWNVLNRNR